MLSYGYVIITIIIISVAVKTSCDQKNLEKKWGIAVVVTQHAIDNVIAEGRKKMQEEISTLKIPDAEAVQSGTTPNFEIQADNLAIQNFESPFIKCHLVKPNGVEFEAFGGTAEVSGNWQATPTSSFVPIPTQSGQLLVKISDIRFNIKGLVDAGSDGRPQLRNATCFDLNMKLDIKMWGGTALLVRFLRCVLEVLGYIVYFFKSFIERLVTNQIQKAICGNLDRLVQAANNAIPIIILPLTPTLKVDLSLTSDPVANEDYLRANYRGAFIAEGRPHPDFDHDISGFHVRNPTLHVNRDKMLTLVITDASINTLLDALVHQPDVGVHVKDKSNNPHSPFHTTCPGYPPRCLGRFFRPLGEKHPNCTVAIDVKPGRENPKVQFSPERLDIMASTSVTFNAIANNGSQHIYPANYRVGFNFKELSMKGNRELLIRRPEVTYFNGTMEKDKDKIFMTPADHERFLQIGGTVMEIFINDFLLESKVLLPENVPLRLLQPEIRLLDGAVELNTDIDFRHLFQEIGSHPKISSGVKPGLIGDTGPKMPSGLKPVPAEIQPKIASVLTQQGQQTITRINGPHRKPKGFLGIFS